AERCAPRNPMADPLGCIAAPAPPCASGGTCDEAMRRCVTACDTSGDADGDGHRSIACMGDDCNDMDPNEFPGHAEVCDTTGHDEDCDPHTFGVRDSDGDGSPDALCCNADATGTMFCGQDCDDTNAGVHPGVPEVCNGIDDNCD